MIRTLLAFALIATFQASAQDYVGTYALTGEDSRGDSVEGWLRIEANGSLEHYLRAGGKIYHAALHGTEAGGVFTAASDTTTGLTGGLDGERAAKGERESLTVRWGGDTVEVEFARGGYASRTRGVRDAARHDLKALRDESPHASFRLKGITRTVVPQPRVSVQAVSYEATTGASSERRVYQELSTDGKSLVKPGEAQTLTRAGERWEPEWPRALRKAQDHALLRSTLRPVGITRLVPERTVAVGEAWTLSAAEGARLLGLDDTAAEGSVSGQLVGVDSVDGGLRYRIRLTFDLKTNLAGFSGPVAVKLRLRVSQSPALHTVTSRLQLDGTQEGQGAFAQQIEQELVVRTLP